MSSTCGFCKEVFQDADPKMTLPCSHIIHSNCIAAAYVLDGFYISCPDCQVPIINEQALEQLVAKKRQQEEDEHNKQLNTYKELEEKDPDFRKQVKLFSKHYRSLNGSVARFRKSAKERVEKYRTDIMPLLETLRFLRQACEKDLSEMPGIREISKKKRLVTQNLNQFEHYPQWKRYEFFSYLRRRKGMRNLSNMYQLDYTYQKKLVIRKLLRVPYCRFI